MRTFGFTAIALAVAASVSWAVPSAHAQKSKDTLRVGFYQPVRMVDSFYDPGPEPTVAARVVFDTLVNYDPIKQVYLPSIVASWKQIDPLTMEFKVRDGITFHDSAPLTIEDVMYTLNFMMDPSANYRYQETRMNWIDKIEKVDGHTFRIRSLEPMAVMLGKLTQFPSVLPKHIHEKLDKKVTFGAKAVGTGPYRVADLDPNVGITLVRYAGYKHGDVGKPAGKIERIRIDPVPDAQTQVARMLRGEQDLMYSVDKDLAHSLEGNPEFKIDAKDSVSINVLMLDAIGKSSNKIFTDKRVREAIMHATDLNNLRQLTHPVVANEKPLAAACHPFIRYCATSAEPPKFDPALAKKMLADAGYPNGFSIPIMAWGEGKEVAEAVAGMWRKVGVNATVNLVTFSNFVKLRAEGVPALVTVWDNSVGQPDIDNTADYWFTPGARNYNNDKVLEQLALDGRKELDTKKRADIYKEMFTRASTEAYLLPLNRIPSVVLLRKEVTLLGGHRHPYGFELNRIQWN
jgi:peptide/nickel transport system substrate-binding protein